MRALIKEFTPCQWSNDEKAWVGIFGNDAEVRDTLNVILEFCTFWGWIVEPEPPLVLGAPQVFPYQGGIGDAAGPSSAGPSEAPAAAADA